MFGALYTWIVSITKPSNFLVSGKSTYNTEETSLKANYIHSD